MFPIAGGCPGGDAPTHLPGEENLPQGEENPGCPNNQAGKPATNMMTIQHKNAKRPSRGIKSIDGCPQFSLI